MITKWSTALQNQPSVGTLQDLVSAFKAAVQQAGAEQTAPCKYIVKESAVFNAVVRTCLSDLLPTLLGLLKWKPDRKKEQLPSTSNKWSKVKFLVKSYLIDILQLVSQMQETVIVNAILRHMLLLMPFFACFPKIARVVMKKLIRIWSTGEETVRVVAFLCINKLTTLGQASMLEPALKQMYMAFVANSKFTSPTTLPMINFMQRSLVEMFAIDVALTYQYAFIYIRQLAIHLRNAITTRKADTCQAVYNWQYIHAVHFWARLLSQLHPNTTLQPLIYPLTQTIIGTIKLSPIARYYPLRFHCVRTLNMLCEATGTFIPVLPFLLEVLQLTDFNKKHATQSFKPINFACILKLSKAQLQEKAFKDGLVDQLFELFVETFKVHAHSIGFPELVLPTVIQMKAFMKLCKVANYTRQMKQILEKVEETSRTITQRRKTATLDIKDQQAVAAWEKRSKEQDTPLSKYYKIWRKKRDVELQHEIAGQARISEDDGMPRIERSTVPRIATDDDRKEFAELFESDSEDSDDEIRFMMKDERPKKKVKKAASDGEDGDNSDDYSDFDEDELEQLAQSASEDEGDSEGDMDDENDNDDLDSEGNDLDDFEGNDSDLEDSDSQTQSPKKSSDKNAGNKPGITKVDPGKEKDIVGDFDWSSEEDEGSDSEKQQVKISQKGKQKVKISQMKRQKVHVSQKKKQKVNISQNKKKVKSKKAKK
eukprot:GHVU01038419.1.p1 GENE.GHVU01038419.1~~GHVU01038419.1.p1  ORF type:complete len:760 (+),score=147.94 GHVU01038419.1:154-2280(+)